MDADRDEFVENTEKVEEKSEDDEEADDSSSESSEDDNKMEEEEEEEDEEEEDEKTSSNPSPSRGPVDEMLMSKIESDEERSIDKIPRSPDEDDEEEEDDDASDMSSDKVVEEGPSPVTDNDDSMGDDISNAREEKCNSVDQVIEPEIESKGPAVRESVEEMDEADSKREEAVDGGEEAAREKDVSDEMLPELSSKLNELDVKVESGKTNENVPVKEISKSVEDQEAELDFEEEVNEERKEDLDAMEEEAMAKGMEDKENKKNDGEENKEKHADGEDDGEVEDDDDLEEGEVKDTVPVSRKLPAKPICRFFNKGQCTWGSACRFIHPGVNDRGNYSMFGASKPLVPSNGVGGPAGLPGPLRGHAGWRGVPPEMIIPPPPVDDTPPVESAWERGLRHAKEILKKANRRKEMEPDFEEKRFNLMLGANEATQEVEKENDYYCKSPYKKPPPDPMFTYGYDELADPFERQAQELWRGGNYENFEVRYLRNDTDYRMGPKEKDKDKDRSRRDKFEKARTQDHNWRDNRYAEVQVNTRGRDDEWKDPWRRSTSPKKRGRSKSYSSASSASSYSSGSSHSRSSSYSSYSRSSSASSYSSASSKSYNQSQSRSRTRPNSAHKSRSSAAPPANLASSTANPAPKKKSAPPLAHTPTKMSRNPPEKKVPSPPVPAAPPVSTTSTDKKKKVPAEKQQQAPTSKPKRPHSPSSGSESSFRRSSGSRSSSRSSVSSRSSSRSSSASSISDYDAKANGVPRKSKEKSQKQGKSKTKSGGSGNKDSSKKGPGDRGFKEQDRKMEMQIDPRMKSMVGSATRTSKDPLKQSGLKPQIKLTLLNKQPSEKMSSSIPPTTSSVAPKKETVNVVKAKPPPPSTVEKDNKFSMKIPMSASKAKAMSLSKPDAKAFGSYNKSATSPESPEAQQAAEPPPMPPPQQAEQAARQSSLNQRSQPMQVGPPHTDTNATAATGFAINPSVMNTGVTNTSTVIGGPSASNSNNRKRPLSPPPPTRPQVQPLPPAAPKPVAAKKSTLSRREELLKQLKAVEDAIARKRAKLS